MATLVMLKAMFKRYGIELKRYYFNTLSILVSIYLFFLVIFFGFQAVSGGGPGFGETAEGLIVGFMVWFLAVFAYAELSWVLIQEAQQGTLEQLSMSPLGLGRVLIGRLSAALVFDIGVMLVFLLLMMASTGRWLNLDFASLLPLLLLTIMSVQGVGFVMGGLALVFKQVQAAFQILQFVFIPLVAVPIDVFPAVKYLPLAWGSQLIRHVMTGGTSILEIPPFDLLFLAANSAVYFGLGFAIFKAFERVARDRGLLGHY